MVASAVLASLILTAMSSQTPQPVPVQAAVDALFAEPVVFISGPLKPAAQQRLKAHVVEWATAWRRERSFAALYPLYQQYIGQLAEDSTPIQRLIDLLGPPDNEARRHGQGDAVWELGPGGALYLEANVHQKLGGRKLK